MFLKSGLGPWWSYNPPGEERRFPKWAIHLECKGTNGTLPSNTINAHITLAKSMLPFRWADPRKGLKKGGSLDTTEIVKELKAERNRLDRAIVALDGATSRTTSPTNESSRNRIHTRGNRRHLTAAGRKRLSILMKKRWAERRKKSSTS